MRNSGIIGDAYCNPRFKNSVWYSYISRKRYACYDFLEKVLCKINSIIGAVISYVLFEFTFKCNIGYLGFFGMNLIELPDSLFANYFTAFWEFPYKQFYSSDYFSLFPWLFLFIFGYFLYNIFESKNLNAKSFSNVDIKPFSFLGRHSLIVYLFHQPILYVICTIINYI